MTSLCHNFNMLKKMSAAWFFFFISPWTFGSTLDATLQAQIYSQYNTQAEKNPALKELLNSTLSVAQLSNLRQFISQISSCDPNQMQGGKVTHRNEYEVLFVPRDNEETELKSDKEVKNYYRSAIQKSLSEKNQKTEWDWKIGADLIEIHAGTTHKEICLRPNLPEEQTFEYLAHEMLHYAKLENKAFHLDILDFKDCDDFARKTAIEPGNEVDAYTLEYSLRIQRAGQSFLKSNPVLQNLFDDKGQLIGPKENFVRYILDDLNYKKYIFYPQCKDHLASQTRLENQKLNALESLLKARKEEKEELFKWSNKRSKIYDAISSQYKAETLRVQGLSEKIAKSITRLEAEIDSSRKRIDLLNQKLTAAKAL